MLNVKCGRCLGYTSSQIGSACYRSDIQLERQSYCSSVILWRYSTEWWIIMINVSFRYLVQLPFKGKFPRKFHNIMQHNALKQHNAFYYMLSTTFFSCVYSCTLLHFRIWIIHQFKVFYVAGLKEQKWLWGPPADTYSNLLPPLGDSIHFDKFHCQSVTSNNKCL